MIKKKVKCPCCGCYTIPQGTKENYPTDGYICEVCFWEIDEFISSDDEWNDVNGLTLNEARENYKVFGSVNRKYLGKVRKPTDEEKYNK